MLGVAGMDTAEIARDWRADRLPVSAAIGGAQERAGRAYNPADCVRRRGASGEVGRDTAGLQQPAVAAVFRIENLAVGANAPEYLAARSGDANVQSDFACGPAVCGDFGGGPSGDSFCLRPCAYLETVGGGWRRGSSRGRRSGCRCGLVSSSFATTN